MTEDHSEVESIRDRYARRGRDADALRYDPLDPYVTLARQERERAMVRYLRTAGQHPAASHRALEVGCGAGGNLLDLIRLGFSPQNLVGNDLLADRLEVARSRLPSGVTLVPGDALSVDLGGEPFDIVLAFTVFTSILDHRFQERLAARIWSVVKPGGGVLLYDFTWNNPRNPDVRGVPVRRIRDLFPQALTSARRVTLAPPIGRRLGRSTACTYPLLNAIPWLRTHVICWLRKPG